MPGRLGAGWCGLAAGGQPLGPQRRKQASLPSRRLPLQRMPLSPPRRCRPPAPQAQLARAERLLKLADPDGWLQPGTRAAEAAKVRAFEQLAAQRKQQAADAAAAAQKRRALEAGGGDQGAEVEEEEQEEQAQGAGAEQQAQAQRPVVRGGGRGRLPALRSGSVPARGRARRQLCSQAVPQSSSCASALLMFR
jgi:hypothetical protein